MYFFNLSRVKRPAYKALFSFLTLFSIILFTAPGNAGTLTSPEKKTAYRQNSPAITTSIANTYSTAKYTTTARSGQRKFDGRTDKNIIFSLMSVILLGFLALFGAIGYHRSFSLRDLLKLLNPTRSA